MTDSTKNNLSDAILVAALSAATYAIAFSYASGYAKYFKIPVALITISPTLLLSAGGTLVTAIIPMYAIANAIWPLLPRSESFLALAIRRLVIFILLFGFAFSPYLIDGEYWLVYGALVFCVAFFELIFPLLTQRKIPSFEQKLSAQDKIERNAASFSFVGMLTARLGRVKVLFLLLLLVVSSFASILGGQEAKKKIDFLVLKGDANVVVLAQYDNVFVTQSYDPKSKVLVGHMKVTKFGDGKEIEITPSNVGPLIPLKVAN